MQVLTGMKNLCGLEVEAMVLKNALIEKFQGAGTDAKDVESEA